MVTGRISMDYGKLGLKCGLEVHQQLDTGKLFCRCPSILRDDAPGLKFSRKLRIVASELGEFDKAALEAFKKNKTFFYEGYSDSTCLIEADEEPPMPADSEALDVTLQIALMLKAHILDELVVMRKQVIDGSNTSGFQRTMLVSEGGVLDYEGGSIGVQGLALEEDAARPMERKESEVTYRLDRLGIPLIELATAPGIKSPEDAGKAAKEIGGLFRITGKAKRGLGTIRQDLNVSIAQGARVEIKGVQQLDLIPEYVRREVERQVKLLEVKDELAKRGVKGKGLAEEGKDLAKIFSNTECKIFKDGLKNNSSVLGLKIAGFAGLLGKELQEGRRFGSELASYVKARAGLRGIFHGDELPAYGITPMEIEGVKKLLGVGENDNFVLVCAPEDRAKKALAVVAERCRVALKGVPEETRNALDNGNTEYSRPLPGAARMYPETDLGHVKIDGGKLAEIRKSLPKSADERKNLYITKFNLSPGLAEKMKLSNHALLFERLVGEGHNPTTAAVLLLEGLVQLRREGVNIERINDRMVEGVLAAMRKKEITQDIALKVLGEWSKAREKSLKEVVKGIGIEKAGCEDVEKVVARVVSKNEAMVKEKGMHAIGALMGDVMKELRGKAAGGEVSALLRKEIEKVMKG